MLNMFSSVSLFERFKEQKRRDEQGFILYCFTCLLTFWIKSNAHMINPYDVTWTGCKSNRWFQLSSTKIIADCMMEKNESNRHDEPIKKIWKFLHISRF